MLDRVIESHQFAFDPLPRLVTDPKLALAGNDQRQVADQPRVDHARVRRNAFAGP